MMAIPQLYRHPSFCNLIYAILSWFAHLRKPCLVRKFYKLYQCESAKSSSGYYRLCIPPKSKVTGFDYFEPEEVGIRESRYARSFSGHKKLNNPIKVPSSNHRLLYDWLVDQGQKPMLINAEHLLANPIPVRTIL